jgi:sec-independent protein translocase protein TatA
MKEPLTQGGFMFEGLFQPMHLLVILGIVLIIFGPGKLPELGSTMGKAIRGFKKSMEDKETTLKETSLDIKQIASKKE